MGAVSGTSVVIGEIRTGLLRNSRPLDAHIVTELLALVPQWAVRQWARPIAHAVSPELLSGVDCLLPSAAGRSVRTVGTLATDVRIIGGHFIQAATRTRVVPAPERRRRAWSHYLAEPGTAESWGDLDVDDLARGFLGADNRPQVVNLAGMTAHQMGLVTASRRLDGKHSLRAELTTLRWVAEAGPGAGAATLSLESPQFQSLWMHASPEQAAEIAEVAHDVALRQWLLGSVLSIVGKAQIGVQERVSIVETLAPAIDHLLHAWFPGARIGRELREYSTLIDNESGMTRLWEATVARIRDQVALASLELARTSVTGSVSAPRVVTVP